MNISTHLNEKSIIDHKDSSLNFIDCNEGFIKCAGFKNKDSILGLNDHDMPWCEYADFYKKHDEDALAGKHYTIIVPLKDHKGDNHIYLNDKYQYINKEGLALGTISFAIEIHNNSLLKLFDSFIKCNNYTLKKACYINKEHSSISLSPREKECLYFLTNGSTSKMTAKVLGISHRTVEQHIENIKYKLRCNNKAEVITLAIEQGLIDIIPNTISIKQLMFPFE